MSRPEYVARPGLDSGGSAVLDDDSPWLCLKLDFSAVLLNSRNQGAGQDGGPAPAHLCLAGCGEQCRNMMTEPLASQIDFPQSVEKEQSGLNDRVFEFFLNKFKRR